MISAYVDRIEEDLAVILLGDEEYQIEIPCSMLPDDINEGNYITLDIKKDKSTTQAALQEAMALMED
ncbi:DUF3006 domain-containing protein [uncultured Anaerovibrio sp.]|uniref:DUF3006 domain-containing protein n=1 Tax=uncultured Anaerovibrio sp. TaxID=361586 RepID=UPI00262C3C05|nr:DUF3006 domain-containing protein [uncultured Anaerovibrio sp.]